MKAPPVVNPSRRRLLQAVAAVTGGSLTASASTLNLEVTQVRPDCAPAPAPHGGMLSVLDSIPARLHPAIANGNCEIDLAPFVNEAIKQADALPGGGAIYFPPGVYEVSEIDASNADPKAFSRALRLIGAGPMVTRIRAARTGSVILNAAGRNNLEVEALQLESGRFEAACAIFLSRTKASPNCVRNQFRNLMISGNYSVSAAISIAAESAEWSHCRFENSNVDARHRCFVTSHRVEVVRLRPAGGGVLEGGPNTDNVMIDCEFYVPFNGAEPVLFDGSAGYSMSLCSIIGGTADHVRMITYAPFERLFTGPITWISPHLEVFGKGNIIHVLDARQGTVYFRSINSYSGNYVVSGATDFLAPPPGSGAQAVLLGSTWTVPHVPWHERDLRFRVYGLSDSAIAFRLADGVGTVQVEGFAADSRIEAAIAKIARRVSSAPE